jgi:hypothetical protein
METLGPTVTTSDYKDATLADVSAEHVRWKVFGNSVLAQLMPLNPHGGTAPWEAEFVINPEDNGAEQCQGIRVKDAVAGQHATVVLQTISPGDPIPTGGVQLAGNLAANGAFTGGGAGLDVIALASFPPASPTDGDTHWLELPSSYDPVGGKKLRWLVTYDSANAVWLATGPALYAEVQTSEATPGAGAYGDMATVGPSIALPRAGDWIIEVGYENEANIAGATTLAMSYAIGATAAVDADAAMLGWSGTTQAPGGTAKAREKTGIAAVTLTAKYKINAGVTNLGKRYMLATPLRIT